MFCGRPIFSGLFFFLRDNFGVVVDLSLLALFLRDFTGVVGLSWLPPGLFGASFSFPRLPRIFLKNFFRFSFSEGAVSRGDFSGVLAKSVCSSSVDFLQLRGDLEGDFTGEGISGATASIEGEIEAALVVATEYAKESASGEGGTTGDGPGIVSKLVDIES
jgi:hypothetical protein